MAIEEGFEDIMGTASSAGRQREGDSSDSEAVDGGRPKGLKAAAKIRGTPAINSRAFVSVALMILLGSFTAAAAKVAVRDLPVSIVPIVRFGVAGLCLIPMVWGKGTVKRLIFEDGWLLVVAAALFVPVNQGFFLNASRFAPTTHVAVFYATAPLIVLLLACALGHERFHRGRLWGMLASIAGVGVIALGNFWGAPTATLAKGSSTSGAVLWGDLLLVGAVASWAAYITLSKPLVARHGVVPVLVGTFLVGTLLDVPVALATHSGWTGWAGVSSASWIALALLALVITPMGQIFQNLSLRQLDASQVATFSNGSPVLTVVWGVWFFEEAMTIAVAIGGLLTLGGIVWSTRLGAGKSAEMLVVSGGSETVPRRDPGIDAPLSSREPFPGLAAARTCRSV